MRIKRYLSFILVFALVLSGATTAFASGNRAIYIEPEETQIDISGPIKFEGEMTAPLYNDNDDVRIIVELNDEPAIAYAQSNNVQYASLPQSTKNGLENNLFSKQEAVKNDFANRGIQMSYAHSFTVAFNGFSGIVKGFEIEAIRNNPSVKNVYIANEYERPEPNMVSSHNMIGSSAIWGAAGYNGEGMVVAIVDTGIDPSHRDLILTEGTEVALTIENVDAKTIDKNLAGKFFTAKVPYGYNYFDLNAEIRDLDGGSQHGMHVAGTVGANGDITNGGIKGVAPEAQLLAMKVFSNNPKYASTFDDIYMKAIEDSIELGVDVVNMSLGGTAAFYEPKNAMDNMITNARDNGVVFAISAGNSAHSTNGAPAPNTHGYPDRNNPDIGLVGSPSLNKDSISVASIENLTTKANALSYIKDGITHKVPMAIAGGLDPSKIFKGAQVFVDGVDGSTKHLGDVKGKIVIVVRGGETPNFVDKIANVQNAGAAGIIVRNHLAGGEGLINMAQPDVHTIPAVFIGYNGGLALMELTEKKVIFTEEMMTLPNLDAGKMSSFTSWGTTPSLELKPEITAPGGQIYSTQNNNGYTMMNGTSMAAPHTAGGSALVLEYIRKNFKDLELKKQSAFAKVLLMNTAEVVFDEYGSPYSPRRQGAGLMRLDRAVETPVTVVNKANGEAKVELKDFTNKVFTMNLTATNHSDKKVTYDVVVDTLANYIHAQGFAFTDVEQMEGVIVSGDTSVTLEAGKSQDIKVTVDLTNAKVPGTKEPVYKNMFVEGFINLVAPTETNDEGIEEEVYPSLVVPYVGFYGDWAGKTSPRILDGMARFNEKSYFGASGIVSQKGTYMGWVPVKNYLGSKERLAISPGTDSEIQGINAVLSFMRNAEALEVNILDSRERLVKKVSKENWVRKTYSNPNSPGVFYSYTGNRLWDGTINNQIAEDGQYFYQIKVLPHYEGAEWQVTNIPFSVDTIAPIIKDLKDKDKKLTWSVSDVGTGPAYFEILLNGKVVKEILASEVNEYNYEGLELPVVSNFTVVAYDFAGNTFVAEVGDILNDTTMPKVSLAAPGQFATFTKSELTFEGSVTDDSAVESATLTIIKEDATKETIKLQLDEAGKFTEVVTLEDGLYKINISAKDIAGNENLGYTITIFVDTTAPILNNIETKVVKSNYITDLTAEQASTSNILLGGGRTIIFVENGQGYAYDRSYLEGDILASFNAATEKYVKLGKGIFVDAKGDLVTSIPAVRYFENTYYANVTMNIEDNFSEFNVYANDSLVESYDNFGMINRNEFKGDITFRVDLLAGDTEINVLVVDGFGNETRTIISLKDIVPVTEEVKITKIKDITNTIAVGEDYSLPAKLQVPLSNGTIKVLPVVWKDEAEVIKEGKVSFDKSGIYTFTGTIAIENYGGYTDIKLILTVEETAEIGAPEEDNTVTATLDGGTDLKGLTKGVTVKATLVQVVETEDIKPAGDIVKFEVTGLAPAEKEKGITITMPSKSDSAVLSFYNENTNQWEAIKGSKVITVGENKFVQGVVYHFSTYGVLEATPRIIANGIKSIEAPAKDSTTLILPSVQSGFTVSIATSSDNKVIKLDGTIIPPAQDTQVTLVLAVEKGNKMAYTSDIKVIVPGATVDKTALTGALDLAAAKVEAEYTAESWTAFQTALTAAKAMPETTQAEVDAKVLAVNEAVAKLVVKPLFDEKVLEDLADKLILVYQHLTDAEKANIQETRTNLQDFVSNTESDWNSVIEDLITDEVIARFGTREKAISAIKDFVGYLSEVYYTTDRADLINLLKEFNLEYEDEFTILFGNDITLVDMFQLLIAAKAELANVIRSAEVDVFAFGTKEEIIELVPALIARAATELISNEYSNFGGKLSDLGWNIQLLVSSVDNMSKKVSIGYKAEMALALAIVRSEVQIEVSENIVVGDLISIKLRVMNKDISSLVDWHIVDADMVSEAFEALKAGETTIIAHRASNVSHWIAKIGITILAE